MRADYTQEWQPSKRRTALLRVIVPPFALALWLLTIRAFSGASPRGEITRLQTLILLAVLGWVFIAGVVDLLYPALVVGEDRALAWLLRTCLLLPIAFFAASSAQAALLPAPIRAQGRLPDIVALLGQDRPTVERLLGKSEQTEGWVASASVVPVPPALKSQAHPVVYGLPDLASPDAEGETEQPVSGKSPEAVDGDAKVIVYFSAAGPAEVVHLELSRAKAAELLGSGWLQRLLSAAGLTGSLSKAPAPPWAESGRRGAGAEKWGFSEVEGRRVAYHLRTLESPPAGVRTIGVGAVSLTVGRDMLDPPPQQAASIDEGSDEIAVPESAGIRRSSGREFTRDFWDREFYVIVLGHEQTAKAARRKAQVLNERASASGIASPAVTVETAGHLQLGGDPSDYVLVFSVGFETGPDAGRRARGLWWPLRTFTSVESAVKRCREFTFSDIE